MHGVLAQLGHKLNAVIVDSTVAWLGSQMYSLRFGHSEFLGAIEMLMRPIEPK